MLLKYGTLRQVNQRTNVQWQWKMFSQFFHARFVGKNMFIKMHHFNYREAEHWAIRVVIGGVCSLSSALSTTRPTRSALRQQAKSPEVRRASGSRPAASLDAPISDKWKEFWLGFLSIGRMHDSLQERGTSAKMLPLACILTLQGSTHVGGGEGCFRA